MTSDLQTAAQQALDAWDRPHGINYIDFRPYMDALRAALAEPVQEPLTPDKTMELANETAGHHWCDEAHLQRFRAAIEKAHGIGGSDE